MELRSTPADESYVVDTYNCRIDRIDNMTGANWTTLGGKCGSGIKQFKNAGDIALDASGRIYVADTGNSRIIRSDDMLGTHWTSFGTNWQWNESIYWGAGSRNRLRRQDLHRRHGQQAHCSGG
jgi:hypothetical protein